MRPAVSRALECPHTPSEAVPAGTRTRLRPTALGQRR